MIPRYNNIARLKALLDHFPVVGIIGARQVGKTTLAHMLAGEIGQEVTYFDLENPEDLARINDPMLSLKALRGLVVIDEVQRKPGLFPIIRVLSDRTDNPCKFLVLGSASPELLHQSSETLAGRISYHRLSGFALSDISTNDYEILWRRGGFPKSFLAANDTISMEWRREFIRTFLERDIPQLGISINSSTLRRFWTMVAHYHAQVWNSSEFARSFGIADTTIRRYLDVLSSSFVVNQLIPWFENVKKRQVKSPKVYIADSGLLHGLLNLPSQIDIESHPKLGASWEGFIIDQIARHMKAEPEECFFWATHAGAELDLLIVRGVKKYGFEIKRTSSPSVTSSMRTAIETLHLTSLDVIHAGDSTFPLRHDIRAVSANRLLDDIRPLS